MRHLRSVEYERPLYQSERPRGGGLVLVVCLTFSAAISILAICELANLYADIRGMFP